MTQEQTSFFHNFQIIYDLQWLDHLQNLAHIAALIPMKTRPMLDQVLQGQMVEKDSLKLVKKMIH